MSLSQSTELGLLAEQYVAEYLVSKNYRVLGHNYRKPWGEIDVIAEKGGVVVFVEVKANKKEIPGFEPELRVSPDKRHKMIRIGRTYLSDYNYPPEQPWQMDIVAVTFNKERGTLKILHYKNIE